MQPLLSVAAIDYRKLNSLIVEKNTKKRRCLHDSAFCSLSYGQIGYIKTFIIPYENRLSPLGCELAVSRRYIHIAIHYLILLNESIDVPFLIHALHESRKGCQEKKVEIKVSRVRIYQKSAAKIISFCLRRKFSDKKISFPVSLFPILTYRDYNIAYRRNIIRDEGTSRGYCVCPCRTVRSMRHAPRCNSR